MDGAGLSLSTILTSSVSDWVFIFRMTCPRCAFTVARLIPISAAICLLQTARQHQLEHLALALRQRIEISPDFRDGALIVAMGAVPCDRQMDRVQQLLVTDRLGQELNRPGLHGPNRHRNIGMTADENNGQMHVRLDQAVVKLQSAPPRQSDVENEAPRAARSAVVEKFLNRRKQLDAQAY